MNFLKKSLSLGLCMLVFSTASSYAQPVIKRISGDNRYDTSYKISNTYYNKADNVVIASGDKYPDALVGGSLSTQIKAPLLLANKNNLASLIRELKRLSPKNIYILGGNSSISNIIVFLIADSGNYNIIRISGKDRYETADKINEMRDKLFYKGNGENEFTTIHYYNAVSGHNFYDALYSAPFFGLYKTENNLITYLELAKEKTVRDSDRLYANIIGDIKVIYDGDFKYINHTVGKNRYETSVIMANKFKKLISPNLDTVVLASGETYPDGLSAASISGVKKAPILLTSKYKLDPSVKNFILKNNIKNVIIVGGESTISKDIEHELGY